MPSALLHAVLHFWSVSMPLTLHLLAATAGGALLAAMTETTAAAAAADIHDRDRFEERQVRLLPELHVAPELHGVVSCSLLCNGLVVQAIIMTVSEQPHYVSSQQCTYQPQFAPHWQSAPHLQSEESHVLQHSLLHLQSDRYQQKQQQQQRQQQQQGVRSPTKCQHIHGVRWHSICSNLVNSGVNFSVNLT
jgi:hypothetical protein